MYNDAEAGTMFRDLFSSTEEYSLYMEIAIICVKVILLRGAVTVVVIKHFWV